ncbi:hypothetical protein M8J77_000537 [Diaphorina citri]|nr:hypothetical protein M8J77_000537 [Diaphorina citri]
MASSIRCASASHNSARVASAMTRQSCSRSERSVAEDADHVGCCTDGELNSLLSVEWLLMESVDCLE